MTKENKISLEEEIASVKKGLRSIELQYNFWQVKAAIRGGGNNNIMQAFGQVTAQKATNEEYLKYLEDKLKEE
jgi:hypothetical protein